MGIPEHLIRHLSKSRPNVGNRNTQRLPGARQGRLQRLFLCRFAKKE